MESAPRRRAGRSQRLLVTRRDADGELRRRPDELIVEEPLAIQLDGVRVATTMRTPGHDFELAAGFCHGDGLLGGAEVLQCRYCGTGSAHDTDYNIVSVSTGGQAPPPQQRIGTTSSSCGFCGTDAIDDLLTTIDPLVDVEPFPLDLLAQLPELVNGHQPLFEQTGAVHAAAAFDRAGNLVVIREDIGRHNAVDKVVGRLLLDGNLDPKREVGPAPSDLALYVSGRASFEIVQKAWAGGFAAVMSVSAPSALAVQAATVANLQLAGFFRGGAMNVYT